MERVTNRTETKKTTEISFQSKERNRNMKLFLNIYTDKNILMSNL